MPSFASLVHCLRSNTTETPDAVNFTTVKKAQKYIGEFQGKEVRVSAQAFEDLKVAQKVIWQTKQLLPYGAGNLTPEVFASRGESYLRANYGLAKAPQHGGLAESSVRVQAGNCSGHAEVSYKLLAASETDRPVARVSSSMVDHAFCMIGDPRDPTQEAVIVDAWPTFPGAFRLEDGKQSIMGEAPTVVLWTRAGPKPALSLDIEGLKPVPFEEIQGFFKSLDVPNVPGKKLENFIVEQNSRSKFMFSSLSTMENPATTYVTDWTSETVQADEIPGKYFHEKFEGLKAGKKHGF